MPVADLPNLAASFRQRPLRLAQLVGAQVRNDTFGHGYTAARVPAVAAVWPVEAFGAVLVVWTFTVRCA